jgi:hypothetical protein
LSPRKVEYAYQESLKAEENMARNQIQNNIGRILGRGKGSSNRGIFSALNKEVGSSIR